MTARTRGLRFVAWPVEDGTCWCGAAATMARRVPTVTGRVVSRYCPAHWALWAQRLDPQDRVVVMEQEPQEGGRP